MIQLHSHCLVFETANGEHIPCSVEDVSVEVIGEAVDQLDHQLVKEAAAAVLHYFKVERKQTIVTIGEFTAALEEVLRGLGLIVNSTQPKPALALASPVAETRLDELAEETGDGGALLFFPRLRDVVRRELDGSPKVLRFSGLRDCVKQLTGAKRWSADCQSLNDQIVDYLRNSLRSEQSGSNCAMVVC